MGRLSTAPKCCSGCRRTMRLEERGHTYCSQCLDGTSFRECRRCERFRPITEYSWSKNAAGKPYPVTWCKACVRDYQSTRKRNPVNADKQRKWSKLSNRARAAIVACFPQLCNGCQTIVREAVNDSRTGNETTKFGGNKRARYGVGVFAAAVDGAAAIHRDRSAESDSGGKSVGISGEARPA